MRLKPRLCWCQAGELAHLPTRARVWEAPYTSVSPAKCLRRPPVGKAKAKSAFDFQRRGQQVMGWGELETARQLLMTCKSFGACRRREHGVTSKALAVGEFVEKERYQAGGKPVQAEAVASGAAGVFSTLLGLGTTFRALEIHQTCCET